jgi:hypothetical protein
VQELGRDLLAAARQPAIEAVAIVEWLRHEFSPCNFFIEPREFQLHRLAQSVAYFLHGHAQRNSFALKFGHIFACPV